MVGICAGLGGLFVLVLLLFVLAGRKNVHPVEPGTEKAKESIEQTVPGKTAVGEKVKTPSHKGQAKNPLTGEWISKKKAKNRPVAIMTENTKVTQPSYGTSQGDVYYECPMEGGLTRLMVLYQDVGRMKRIGNIRSARNYFIYFAREYDALFIHCGYSHFARELADSDFIDNVNGITGKAEAYMYRTGDRRAPHNLYTGAQMVNAVYKGYNYRRERKKKDEGHFDFAADDAPVELRDGKAAKKVEIYYPANRPWFEYDAKKKIYRRFQYGEKQLDGMNGKQLQVANIIIQECDVRLWEEKTGYMYVDCTSGGKGKYITRGRCIDITWKKKSDAAPTKFYDREGRPITLNQGKTWIEVVDRDDAEKQVIIGKKD